jgi:hypothetical protein
MSGMSPHEMTAHLDRAAEEFSRCVAEKFGRRGEH